MPPLRHFTHGRGRTTAGACGGSVHIDPTWVTLPFLKRISGWLTRCRVVLLDSQIAYRMACSTDSGKQLRFAVEQGLAPLGMAGSHGQRATAQGQWLAVACQSIASEFWPVLPQRSHGAFTPPGALESLQTSADRLNRFRFGRYEQFTLPESAALRFQSPTHCQLPTFARP